MKTRFYIFAVFGLALPALPLLTGCREDGGAQASSLISSANAEPAIAAVSNSVSADAVAAASAPSTPTETAVADTVSAPVAAAAAAEKKLPASLRPSSSAGEVVKLVQAGVDETVMLTYITNAGGMFSLSSDDIIYLNDLGVPNTVVNAMMHHDEGVKSNWANQTAAQPAPAAAPTYANPPSPEPQPAPVAAASAVSAEPAPAANVTCNYFYDSLSPYGTWVEVEGYGRCWQPTVVVVNPGWQPYSDRGHWVYTDSGWYWMSDYSWGWAPFHYGRWFSHPRYGWCWWPDRVWGPSWVSWRYSNDYCGWAPLPPAAYYRTGFGFSYYGRSVGMDFDFGLGAGCFTFVAWNNFCDSRPWHHRVPHHQVSQVFHRTTIVNNYRTGDHNAVINHGISRELVREHTRTELRPVAIRERNDGDGRGGRGERLDHNSRLLIVQRPHIPESATPQMPPPPHGRATVDAVHTPGSGAGVAQRENPRTPEGNRNVEGARERGRQPGNPTPPAAVITPAVPRTPPVTPPPAANPAPATSINREGRGTPRPQEDRRDNSGRDRKRDGSQTPTTSPTARPAPPGSVVVIGRRDQNTALAAQTPRVEAPVNTARNNYNWSPPANPTPAPPQAAAPTPRSSPVPTQPNREERRYAPPSQPTYSAPAPVQRSQPSQPSAPAYRAPSPSPAPSYSPPARSQSSETRSSPPSSERGSGNGGSHDRKDR